MTSAIVTDILHDLQEPIRYLPMGVAAGLIVLLLLLLSGDRKKLVSKFLLWSYLIVVLMLAYFSREPGSRNSVDLGFLDTWTADPQGRAFVIENILMFIPYGILVPWALSIKSYQVLLSAAFASFMIEAMQLITQRGHCQLDDLIMNTLGAMIGLLIWKIIRKIF